MENIIDFLRKSVRPGLAWVFGLAIVAGFFGKLIQAETFIGIAGSIMAFYFNSREKRPEQERK